VKEHVTGWAVSVGSGLGAALAGAPWWAVVLVVALVLGSTYGMMFVAIQDPKVRTASTFLMSVEKAEPEEPPPQVPSG
jgi:hypothetical protein